MIRPEQLLADRHWRRRHSRYAWWSLVGGGFISLLYTGIRAKRVDWLTWGAIYGVIMISLTQISSALSPADPDAPTPLVPGLLNNAFVIVAVVSGIHVLRVRKDWLRWKATALGQPQWYDASAELNPAPSNVPSPSDVAWGGRVAVDLPWRNATEQIDPFALAEPWRRYVVDALGAQARFHTAVNSARTGPLQDRLREIEDRVDTGVREVWGIAGRGHELADAVRRIDPASIRAEVALCTDKAVASGSATDQRTLESLRSQLASGERLEAVIGDTDSQLRWLNARLDEAVVGTIELSVQAEDVADLGGLRHDVDQVVDEIEALRQAIDETGGGPSPSTPT